MVVRGLTQLIVMVFGALVLFQVLTFVPARVSDAMEAHDAWHAIAAAALWPLVLPAALGTVMLFWPGKMVNRMIGAADNQRRANAPMLHVALSILGFYFLGYALAELGLAIGSVISLDLSFSDERPPAIVRVMNNDVWGSLIGHAVQALASVALIMWAGAIARWCMKR